MVWQGGQCPSCGEDVPKRMVSCRYCHATLVCEELPNVIPVDSLPAPLVPVSTISPIKASRVEAIAPQKRFPLLLWLVGLLLFSPLLVSGPVPNHPSALTFTWPMVHSGDEPHYLVILNSLVKDGDLDVANNYANVHAGGNDAGRKFAGWALDHHVTWYRQDSCIFWWEVYENDSSRWGKGLELHPVPTLRQNSNHGPVSDKEYSQHAPGLPLLLAPFLFPFGDTKALESLALLASSLVTVGGFLAFHGLVRPYVSQMWHANLLAAVAYLGSPLWHYGRTFYVEPYAATFVVIAFAVILRRDRYLLGGTMLGMAVLLKSPFGVIAIPLVLDALWRKKWSSVWRICLPLAIAAGITLFWNKQMRQGWFHMPQRFDRGFPLEGVIGLLFSWRHGLLLFTPILVGLVWSIPPWFSQHRRDAILISTAVMGYLLLMGCYAVWWGGACYSARYLVPVLPLLFAPLAKLPVSDASPSLLGLFVSLTIASLVFGGVAAFACEHVWGKHPIQLMF